MTPGEPRPGMDGASGKYDVREVVLEVVVEKVVEVV
jgi:hypothetical protein